MDAAPLPQPRPVAPEIAARTGDALRAAGFTPEGVLERLGAPAMTALAQDLTQPARRVLDSGPSPLQDGDRGAELDGLIRLFLLGDAPVDSSLPAHLVSDLVSLGLVHSGSGALRARLDLRPYGEPDTDWYLVSDLGHPRHPDHVLGLGGASLTLARVTPRTHSTRVLDLGCGAGVQVLHAARHSDRLVATDTNPRALWLTELSALLSGIERDRLDLRLGSLYEPVAGERFDLIVSNPPFVISPGHRFTYRDAGLPGDELSARVVRGAAGLLAPGGRAAVLANWLHRSGESWAERVTGWVAGSGVSAWVVQRETQSVVEYAVTWLRDSGTAEADLDAALDAWLDEFEAQGAEGVGFGWVVLAAPATGGADPGAGRLRYEPWLLVEDLSAAGRLPDSSEVETLLVGSERLAALGIGDLLGSDWRLVEGATVEERSVRGGTGAGLAPPLLGRAGHVGAAGWRAAIPTPPLLLTALTTEHPAPLGDRLDAACADADTDPLDALPTALITLRELRRHGIVHSP